MPRRLPVFVGIDMELIDYARPLTMAEKALANVYAQMLLGNKDKAIEQAAVAKQHISKAMAAILLEKAAEVDLGLKQKKLRPLDKN